MTSGMEMKDSICLNWAAKPTGAALVKQKPGAFWELPRNQRSYFSWHSFWICHLDPGWSEKLTTSHYPWRCRWQKMNFVKILVPRFVWDLLPRRLPHCDACLLRIQAQFANMSKNLLRSFMDKLAPKLRALYSYSIITVVLGWIPFFKWE